MPTIKVYIVITLQYMDYSITFWSMPSCSWSSALKSHSFLPWNAFSCYFWKPSMMLFFQIRIEFQYKDSWGLDTYQDFRQNSIQIAAVTYLPIHWIQYLQGNLSPCYWHLCNLYVVIYACTFSGVLLANST